MSTFDATVFGKYFLVDKIATGGMAEIFKAKTYSHGGFENLLVIKRILPHISANEDFVDMFIDEAKISVALQHPNIVRIYDFGKILDNYYIAMECVEGKDVRNCLRKLARRREWMPPRFCAFIAYETCKGLHYAHTKTDPQGHVYGIVHRDISPSNVLVAYDGHVKVADFGIAKAESNAYQTRDGLLKGKFEYMSPEQAQGKEIDHRSDLFSLGIILYETMTGRRLFKTDSEMATLKKIRDLDLIPPRQQKPDLPEELERICLKALEKYPEDRYATAQEMADDLRNFLSSDPDTLRAELQDFMDDLFADEISEERARLETGSAAAAELRERLPADWDGQTDSTMGPITQTAVGTAVPWIAGAVVIMLGLFGLALVGVLYIVAQQTTGLGEQAGIEQPVETTGSIAVMVQPEATISIDGEDRGKATVRDLDGLEPGTYNIKLEAEGYTPYSEAIEVTAGGVARINQVLQPIPGSGAEEIEEPEPEPEPSSQPRPSPTGPPRVSMRSSPSGATVKVDGSEVGTTPMTWSDADAGSSYRVTLELAGYETYTGTLKARRGRQTFSRTLTELQGPGKLTVTLVGGGWANVYVDGEKLGKTAPLKEADVSPGSHEIRVENPALGIDQTETHTFSSGSTVTIRAKPQ